jgi:hypothetical protein
MSLATTAVAASYPSAGLGDRATTFRAAVEYVPCVQQSPPTRDPLVHPSMLHRFLFAPCLAQTPPLLDSPVHPPWLQRLAFAPCEQQTPPLTAPLAQPATVQRLPFAAPCAMHRPRVMTPLVHPSWLHRAPCEMQNPPLLPLLVHPSRLQRVFLPMVANDKSSLGPLNVILESV